MKVTVSQLAPTTVTIREGRINDRTSGDGWFWLLIGVGLCSAIPIVRIGPSFITWPSCSEISGVALLLISLSGYRHISKYRPSISNSLKRQIMPACLVTVLYISFITILFTGWNDFAIVYPMWATLRFLQWALIIPFILLVCKPQHLRLLVVGLIIGGVLNALVSILQRFGFLSPKTLFLHLDIPGAGPYGTIAEKGLVSGESIGLFSYTRIATGFFLTLTFFAAVLFLKHRLLKISVLVFLAIGIVFTGSRTAIVLLGFALLALAFDRKLSLVVLAVVFVVGILAVNYLPLFAEDARLGRLLNIGEERYSSGIKGRLERQSVLIDLPIQYQIFGCGMGNAGSALGFADLRLYRAHGYIITYLVEIGIVGTMLLSYCMYKLLVASGTFHSYYSLIVLGIIVLSGFSDDFMIPSAQSAHLPLIAMIVLRFSVLKRDHFTL